MTQILLLLQQNFPIDFSGASQGILTSSAYKNILEWESVESFLELSDLCSPLNVVSLGN